jgi:phage virion morphogenesis protein
MPDKDLARLDEWFGRILKGLSPAERRRAALKLGQALRRSNLKRIAANIDPDGTPFAPRKARYDRKGRLRTKAGGKMFQGLRYAKHWRIDADEDGVELSPPPRHRPHGRRQPVRRNRHRRPPAQRHQNPRPLPRTQAAGIQRGGRRPHSKLPQR